MRGGIEDGGGGVGGRDGGGGGGEVGEVWEEVFSSILNGLMKRHADEPSTSVDADETTDFAPPKNFCSWSAIIAIFAVGRRW